MIFQSHCFGSGEMDNRSMFGRREVSRLHDAFIKAPQIGKVLEILHFAKSKIVRVDTINIVHQYPFLFANPFPHRRRFTSLRLWIVPFWIVHIVVAYGIGYRLLNARNAIVRYIKQMKLIAYLYNIPIDIGDIMLRKHTRIQ